MECLPTFFIVGAQKAGTTTLHAWLNREPQVCLPLVKETHYFCDNWYYRGIEWYRRQFTCRPSATIIGEIDPEYMFFPEVPHRIAALMANPRLVFVLRDPLARAYSSYLMAVRRGYERLSFTDALAAEEERLRTDTNRFAFTNHSYIARGLYANQIRRYQEIMPGAPKLYMKFENLFSPYTGPKLYMELCEFIGLKAPLAIPDFADRHNAAVDIRSTMLRDLIYRPHFLKQLAGRLLGSDLNKQRVRSWLDNLNTRPARRSRQAHENNRVPAFVHDLLKRDVAEVIKLTGLDLGDWRFGDNTLGE